MRRTLTAFLFILIGTAIGAAFIRFYAKPETPPATQSAGKERKILFYRAPMNPSVTSPAPRKDEMGMDYVPVYEEEASAPEKPGVVTISPEKIQKIGVKSEKAARRNLTRVIRTVGRVEPVEGKVYVINSKVSGWVEKLHVSQTDQMVMKGEKLLDLYSPDLVSAQEEYLLALKGLEQVKASPYPEVRRGAEALLDAAARKLGYWDIFDDQIKRLRETGAITRTMTIKAPESGSVTEKMVVEGQKIEAGEPLFKTIDHSVVWVYGEVYEYEMPYVKTGETATLFPSYSPTEVYNGKIEHIYNHLGSIRYTPEGGTEVRTEKVRFEVPNRDYALKLGMYLNIEIKADIAGNALAVPDSAVIDTGTRQLVIIDRRDGTFEPRDVTLGVKAEGYDEVLKGVKEGDYAVTSANFLIDSESNLNAAISGISGAAEGHAAGKKEEKKEEPAAGRGGH